MEKMNIKKGDEDVNEGDEKKHIDKCVWTKEVNVGKR